MIVTLIVIAIAASMILELITTLQLILFERRIRKKFRETLMRVANHTSEQLYDLAHSLDYDRRIVKSHTDENGSAVYKSGWVKRP